MNISGIKAQPCELMDQYDKAMYRLHEAIIHDHASSATVMALIAKLQGESLTIRNKIADQLQEHSWCHIPEENRL